MRSTSFLPALAGLAKFTAAYTLQQDYGISSFFNNFDFFTSTDPTHGYVTYVDQSTAQSTGLISTGSSVYIGADYTNVASGNGRPAVRISSTATYTHGLVILDLAHMPGGVCGTWPAFWLFGPDWPNNGEVDIIEGVNSQTNNDMTLHTSDGCSISNTGFTGTLQTSNCYVDAPGQSTNAGCQITASSSQSYGTGFNDAGGGVYATEWTSTAISIWFWPRGSIPSDVTSGSPDPSGWGTPTAYFAGACDIDAHFNSMQIVFDTTFCGDWAGNAWASDPVCSALASTCEDYVQNNPSAFQNAYWQINSLKVYQQSSNTTSGIGINVGGSVNATVPLKRSRRSRHMHGH